MPIEYCIAHIHVGTWDVLCVVWCLFECCVCVRVASCVCRPSLVVLLPACCFVRVVVPSHQVGARVLAAGGF